VTDQATATLRVLTGDEAHRLVGALSDVLIDCVEGGASVGFMAPLTRERADRFWRGVADGVAAGGRILLVAENPATGDLLGTAQLIVDMPENQPHRADVAKVLVRRSARRRGLGAVLMTAVEAAARDAGKTLLVLDTTTGDDAERMYTRLGWTRVGEVPRYAHMPDGTPSGTTFFYKDVPHFDDRE